MRLPAIIARPLAAILDAGERTYARRDLRLYGRATAGDEDRLLPQSDRDTVVLRCHDLRRNNPIITGACDRIMDNVIGPQIIMQARTDDEKWNAVAEEWLANWSAAIDPAGRTSLTDAARLTVTGRLYDGEIFHQPTPEGCTAIIESERIRPPTKNKDGQTGVRTDPATGRVISWLVHGRDKSGAFDGEHAETWVPDLIHCARRWRPDQIRGWPDLSSVANIVTDIHEINAANLKKQKMGALAAWVYQKGQSGARLQGRGAMPEVAGSQPLSKFREGMIYEIEQGGTLAAFQNNSPGGEYAPFIELNLRLVGMALGLPYEFLLLYFGGGSFASSKASLLQAYKTIESWQSWLDAAYLKKVIPWRIAKAIRDRELPPAPVVNGKSQFAMWEWQRPGVEWIDPQNAIQTEMQEVRIGASDMQAVCARRGRDPEKTARNNARYLKMLDRVGKEEGVDPARLHNIQIPGQTPTAAAPVPKPETDDDEKKGGSNE
jgi:lambda family phage portal protein